MKNLRVQCEDPAIILNPHLKDLVLKYGQYHTPSGIVHLSDEQRSLYLQKFPYSTFRGIKKHLTESEASLYYVVDMYGDEQPLFLVVPCGKCILCREKKANEWVSRAMCETQTSTNIPYFITLTYNDSCIPKNGVRKRAAQLFMKRLRVNMARYTGEALNIRFFLCSEYGSKSGRPHYHALLWNVPNLDPNRDLHDKILQDVVQKSWSFMVSKKYYDKVSDEKDKYGYPIYKYYDDVAKRHRVLYGYTCCSECNIHRVRYCMKYMRKDSDIPFSVDTDTGEIKYKNDVFFLSSRRRGLGFEWINAHLDEYRNNPSLLDVQLTCKFSGEAYKGCLPRYFKDLIAPTPSRVISKDIRDAYAEYNLLYDSIERYLPYVNSLHQRVLEHYPALYYHRSRVPHEISSDIITSVIKDKIIRCDELEWMLLAYEYDSEILQFVPQYKHEHNKCIEDYAANYPDIPIPDKVALIQERRLRSRLREQL